MYNLSQNNTRSEYNITHKDLMKDKQSDVSKFSMKYNNIWIHMNC